MNIDSSQGRGVSNIIFRNGLEPEKGATRRMIAPSFASGSRFRGR
jgi:hypothetical protein